MADFQTKALDQNYSALCSLGPRPIVLNGMLRLFLADHFSRAEEIEHPGLRDNVWARDEDCTGIAIEDANVWRPGSSDKRPAILLRRGGWRFSRRTIGGNMGRNVQGQDEKIEFCAGSHTIFAIGRSAGEAEILGTEVYKYMRDFAEPIRQAALLHRFQLVDYGAVAVVEESSQHFAVPITFVYSFEETWVVEQSAEIIKHVRTGLELFPDC